MLFEVFYLIIISWYQIYSTKFTICSSRFTKLENVEIDIFFWNFEHFLKLDILKNNISDIQIFPKIK